MVDIIFDVMLCVFVECGYVKININFVVELVGISVGLLYQYFFNKDVLIFVLCEWYSMCMFMLFEDVVVYIDVFGMFLGDFEKLINVLVVVYLLELEFNCIFEEEFLVFNLLVLQEICQGFFDFICWVLEKYCVMIMLFDLDVVIFVVQCMMKVFIKVVVLIGYGGVFLVSVWIEILFVVIGYLIVLCSQQCDIK